MNGLQLGLLCRVNGVRTVYCNCHGREQLDCDCVSRSIGKRSPESAFYIQHLLSQLEALTSDPLGQAGRSEKTG